MEVNGETQKENKGRAVFRRFDRLAARLVPNSNVRAIIYLTIIFVLALYLQFVQFSHR